MPPDVLQRAEDITLLQRPSAEPESDTFDEDKLRQAAQLLHAAERPVIADRCSLTWRVKASVAVPAAPVARKTRS